MPHSREAIAKGVALGLPLIELLLFAYSAFVFTCALAQHSLLGQYGHQGAAIAVLVLFWLLLLLALGPFFRGLFIFLADPAYVTWPRARSSNDEEKAFGNRGIGRLASGKVGGDPLHGRHYSDNTSGGTEGDTTPQNFFNPENRQAYVCDGDGLPQRCNFCKDYKLDRRHHSSDLGMCVDRMDHFCPWFGGVVGKQTHKFFMQFIFFTFIWSVFGWITLAYFVSQTRLHGDASSWMSINMYVALGFLVFFSCFTSGMAYFTAANICLNMTDIEKLQGVAKFLAIKVNNDGEIMRERQFPVRFFGPHDETEFVAANAIATNLQAVGNRDWKAYAIIPVNRNENPFDQGSLMANWKAVMGSNILDWALPIRASPAAITAFGPLPHMLALRYNIHIRP